MSNLFKQISQEAAAQRAQISEPTSPTPPVSPVIPSPATLSALPVVPLQEPQPQKTEKSSKKVVPQSGTTVPDFSGDRPTLDMKKLKTIIAEISEMSTNYNGLNVRMSAQEQSDLEDFVQITLRKQGLRGYEVSIAKLMRYAMRYMFRVHEKEFISALKQVLKTEDTLSI